MFRLFSKLYFKLSGWKVVGGFPDDVKKYVCTGAPHTSNWDFIYSIMMRSITGMKAKFLAKKELFRFPFGYIFRAMGGYPIERKQSQDMVQAVIEIFNSKEEFAFAITPEGTRKYVPKWKTGFYYIAVGAKVPIIMVAFDYEHKEIRMSEPFYPTGNMEEDWKVIENYYRGVKGRFPEHGTYT